MECSHPSDGCVEGEYEPGTGWGYARPPFAVCTACGYAEVGWGCGYWRLGGRGKRLIPRVEARRLVRGTIKTQDQLSAVRYDRAPLENLWGDG